MNYSAIANRKNYGWIEIKEFDTFNEAVEWTKSFLRSHADEYHPSGLVECHEDHSHKLVVA